MVFFNDLKFYEYILVFNVLEHVFLHDYEFNLLVHGYEAQGHN